MSTPSSGFCNGLYKGTDAPPSLQVVIDSCVIGAPSAFMQQAAHLTGGVYLCPARPAGLLQYLLMVRCCQPTHTLDFKVFQLHISTCVWVGKPCREAFVDLALPD